MSYRIESNGRYELYNVRGELEVKVSDINYIAEVRGNNPEYVFVDTKSDKN